MMSMPTMEATPVADEARAGRKPRRRSPRSALRPALESALIVFSVLLAFGLNEWRMQRADRALASSVLTSFRQEIQANLELLEQFQPLHAALAEAIAALDPATLAGRRAIDVVTSVRVDGGTVLMAPGEAAWQTAVSTGALRLLDYEMAAVLSRIYLSQREYAGRTAQRLTDVVFSAAMFDPAATRQALHIAMALLNELAAQEASLMGEYRFALGRLEALGIGADPPR
jgi:hypothetical protein